MIVRTQGDVIALSGALTANHWHTIKAAASLLIKEEGMGILIDCQGISRATPAGLQTFREAVRFFSSPDNRGQTRIVVCQVPPCLAEHVEAHPRLCSGLVFAASHEEARDKLGKNCTESYQAWVEAMHSKVGGRLAEMWRSAISTFDDEDEAAATPDGPQQAARTPASEAPVRGPGLIVRAHDDIVSLKGSLSSNHWLTIKAAASLIIKQQGLGLILDCSGLTRITAEGSHTFRDAVGYFHSQSHKTQGRIIVCGLSDEMRKIVLKEPGVRSCLAVAGSVEEARASFKLESWNKQEEGVVERPSVMVPLLEDGPTEAAILQGCQIAREGNLKMYLVAMLQVPMAHHLDAPLPELEDSAEVALAKATAAARVLGVQAAPHIRRTRDAADGLHEAALELKARCVVVGLPRRDLGQPTERLLHAIVKQGSCELRVIYGATPPTAPQLVGAGVGGRETTRLPAL